MQNPESGIIQRKQPGIDGDLALPVLSSGFLPYFLFNFAPCGVS